MEVATMALVIGCPAGVVNNGVGEPPLAAVEVPALFVTPQFEGLVLVKSKRQTFPSKSPA
jgi:hypothetical protein